MIYVELTFWFGTALVTYAYLGYPLLLWLWNRVASEARATAPYTGTVSLVLAVHNEEGRLAARLRELIDLLQSSGLTGEVIVVSDGSTDGSAALARSFAGDGVQVIEVLENVGKAAAISQACAQAVGEVIVFADVRQRWDAQALNHLLSNFADARVGAVSGDLVLEQSPGVLAGVGLYWRYEKWLRKQESRARAMVGVTGAISAVRRALFRPIPPGTLLDDVYWPLQVAMQGFRVIHDERAVAYDRLPDKAADEFRRKVRTLSGNFQLMQRLPTALVPWRNPIWLQYVSHKLLRLAVPWALLGMLAASAMLPGWFYRGTLLVQLAGYGWATLGLA